MLNLNCFMESLVFLWDSRMHEQNTHEQAKIALHTAFSHAYMQSPNKNKSIPVGCATVVQIIL